MVDREPAPGPPEAGHHLVGDHQDVVARADLANARDVAVGRDQDAVRPDDRLEEDRGDALGALVADDVLESLEALGHGTGFRLSPAVGVRVADDADDARLVGPAARVAGQGHRPERRTVVGAIAGEDLVPAGDVAGELDGVLDRLRTAKREEDLIHVARQDLGELRSESRPDLRGEGGLHVLELQRLGRDRVDDPAVAVTDVDRHQLAVEIEDALALGGVQVDAFGMVDGDGVEGALDGPGEEGVLPGQGDDLVAGHAAGSGRDAHGSPRGGRTGRRRLGGHYSIPGGRTVAEAISAGGAGSRRCCRR